MFNNFTIRQQRMFPSYTIDVKEQYKIDRFLQLLNKSGAADILDSVKEKQESLGGRPSYNIYNLFATILYGFAFGTGTLRDLETSCKNDLRYLYLMQEEQPTYRTLCNFINDYIVPNADALFQSVCNAIVDECGISLDDAYIDGTKIEANANKYKFVWKPTTFHIRLSDKIRTLLALNNLDRGIPNTGIISSSKIAEKLAEYYELIKQTKSENKKKILIKQADQLSKYLEKSLEYEEKELICGPNRNSYYKTDHDATAMTLKTDYYSGLGSNMHAAYNVQAIVSQGFVTAFYLSQSRNDITDLIPTLEQFYKFHGKYPLRLCADSGYGSLDNYSFLDKNGIENYVKHVSWQGNVSGKNPSQFHLNNDDTITCLNGNIGNVVAIPDRHPKKANSVFYKVVGCKHCEFSTYCKRWQKNKNENFKIFEVVVPLRRYIQQAEENLLSVQGINMRVNRSIQSEGAFGCMKQNMHYVRFRRTSIKKVTAEYMLTFLGFNIRKLFKFYSGNLKTAYWKAPTGMQAETFKKPSAKRLANTVNRKNAKSKNAIAKDSYKHKKGAVKT
ncbi:MAG: transposase [Bacillota bacterium]|nr:transposase [Bacillota bacterium]